MQHFTLNDFKQLACPDPREIPSNGDVNLGLWEKISAKAPHYFIGHPEDCVQFLQGHASSCATQLKV
jgi:hypothetical protein